MAWEGKSRGEKKGAHTRTPNPNRETNLRSDWVLDTQDDIQPRLAVTACSMPCSFFVPLTKIKANVRCPCFYE
jgi:hypothetical protein